MMASSVTPAVTGAATGEAPSGTSASWPRMTDASVIGISISTVPATVGVKIPRGADSLAARTNWNSDDTMISVAASPGTALLERRHVDGEKGAAATPYNYGNVKPCGTAIHLQ